MSEENSPPFKRTVTVLSTWFYLGKIPKAPGTFGSLGAIPLVWLFCQLGGDITYMTATLVFAIFSIFVAHMHEGIYGNHDASEIVIDEVAGMLVTMAAVPFRWEFVLLGFLVFRLFDIWKPYPISYADKKIGGGVGVVADDLLAGILSNIILQVVLRYWSGF